MWLKFHKAKWLKITHHLDIIFTGCQEGRKPALMWWPNMPLWVTVFLLLLTLNCTNNHLKLFTYSIKHYLCLSGMYRSSRERDICYISVICYEVEFSLKGFMSKSNCSKTVTCTNLILWAILFVKYNTYSHKICSSSLTPWRYHFQGLASLIWCPEPLSFNYGSQSLTGRQDSSQGHHDMCKNTGMCMSVFHTIFNFLTNQFSDNLVEIYQNVKEGNATNKDECPFHLTLHINN
jgi:hypothetical protein